MSTTTIRPIYNTSGGLTTKDYVTLSDNSDATYLKTVFGGEVPWLYKTSVPRITGAISAVTAYVRLKTELMNKLVKPAISTHGTSYLGTQQLTGTSFATYYHTWTTNPYTGVAWTIQETADLSVGFWLNIGTSSLGYIADAWIVITHTDGPIARDQYIYPVSNNSVTLTPNTGSNYDCVNDDQAAPDDDSSYVRPNTTSYQIDLYNLGSPPLPYTEIFWVRVVTRSAGVTTGAILNAIPVLSTHSTTYYPRPEESLANVTSYSNYEIVYGYNPYTGSKWTDAEVTDLIAGVRMYSSASGYWPKCTQVFVEVYGLPKSMSRAPQIIGLMW